MTDASALRSPVSEFEDYRSRRGMTCSPSARTAHY